MIIEEAKRLGNVSEYYFSKKLDEIREMQKSGKNVINLGIGSPDLCPSENTIEALYKSAKNPANHGYQNYRGIPELRKAIADFYKKIYNVPVNENEVLPLMGSKEGIMHISMAFLNKGDEVLIPNPGYPTYTSVSNLVEAKIRYYELEEKNEWSVNIDKLKNSDLSKVKIMWLNYPNMPTGARISDKFYEELISFAKEKKILLCNDNPYSMVLNDSPKSLMEFDGACDVAIELNSLSKSHNMAGWRVGWIIGNKDYINSILKVKSNMDSGMFLGIQHAAVEALNNPQEWHAQRNEVYKKRKVLAEKLLDILNCKYSDEQVGMFVWARIPDNIESVEKFTDDILYNSNVFITPGIIFGTNGSRYVRVSLCCKENVFEEAIKRISNKK
ncbi:MAG: aminotransferase class I/II-fold pyridoxal phosphate-dependent enzyme [Bacteroidales bacterium]|nr:aminotransferase class I/II-fold pyridoxal phosphate-dependent enzyme [Bacteroidales bacterium]